MTATDLRQRVRDRSVFVFGLVVPLALISVFNLVFGDSENIELEPVTVVAAVPEGDQLASTVTDALRDLEVGDLRVSLEEASAGEVRGEVDAGRGDLGIVFPEGFGEALRAGDAVTVDVVEGDGHEVETQIVLSVVDGALRQLADSSVTAQAAARSGVAPAELEQVARDAVQQRPEWTLARGEASAEQLNAAGALVAGQAGLFVLFTVGFGVLGLVAEREMGTLARLRSMPMRPELIVLAKALVSFLLGVGATAVLLTVGGLLFDVGFGSVPAVAVLILCVVAAATSVMLVIARVARTSEQANIAQSITALVLGIAGGAFFPVAGPGWVAPLLDLNPIAAFTRGLGITAGGGGLADLAAPVAVMLGFTVVVVALSRLVPDRGAAS
jgi:ABC-2 type transport system permease protein